MTSHSITIDGLEKVYKGSGRKEQAVHALKPLSLQIAPGEVFGLLGPNGAGKTTLVKLLLGIAFPTSGRAQIFDEAVGTTSSKRLVGYLPENHRYPAYLSGERVLRYFGRLSGVESTAVESRMNDLLELVNMSKWRHTKVRKYSKGMMQRIGIAQALINDPRVVFLDEPTDGVDPVGRREIRDVIETLKHQGKTIFLNSHLLSEVEMICDRVAILDKGEMKRIGTVKELTETSRLYQIETSEEQREAFARVIAALAPRDLTGARATVEASDLRQLNQIIDKLRSEGILIHAITPVKLTLEEYFINVVGPGDKP